MSALLKKSFRPLVITAVLGIAAAVALPAWAQIVPPECRIGGSGCTLCHIGVLAINITEFMIYRVAFPLTALLIAAGGLILLTAGTSESRITLGKKILTNTLIGIIIVLLAWLAVDTVIKVLTGGNQLVSDPLGKLGPWNKLDPTGCPL
ncbi:MAG: hypothetical protein HY473_01550 [Candidatus Sungbacteria bacterium]|uniref:Uncharacterized protein n=1 Tax=Candidatus Sungiibacteriota bacterium TaxID=2750080 RepID=A0A932YWJ0_9BACT|nr:hypothetical protein [Candidatus Sungbacteria bacterium]